jgi:hypothetical protein
MSPVRLAIAALTVAVLAGLFIWQSRREEVLKACLAGGGVWDGPASACREPVRPILRRDLERS